MAAGGKPSFVFLGWAVHWARYSPPASPAKFSQPYPWSSYSPLTTVQHAFLPMPVQPSRCSPPLGGPVCPTFISPVYLRVEICVILIHRSQIFGELGIFVIPPARFCLSWWRGTSQPQYGSSDCSTDRPPQGSGLQPAGISPARV